MKYHDITHDDMKNGDGLRVVLWLSGCSHRCSECQNPITWDYNDGIKFDINAMYELFYELSKPYISGLTLSGGDPFFISNREEVTDLCNVVKTVFPDKTIWVYTGYTWSQLLDRDIRLDDIDVIVDGRYVKSLRDVNYHWAGSTNQRVINVQDSLKEGRVVLHESN